MSRSSKPWRRPEGQRRYKKLFVVSTEGSKTEPQYFDLLNSRFAEVRILCLDYRGGRSPDRVLKKLDKYLKEEGLADTDEAWLVIDRDRWPTDEIDRLHSWVCSKPNRHLAVSDPCFEHWLLLHFEDGDGVSGLRDCVDKLKRYLPGYKKGVNPQNMTEDKIRAAVERAKRRYQSQGCPTIPTAFGSTVYKLVESILNSANETD
jgi:hypothetical protein